MSSDRPEGRRSGRRQRPDQRAPEGPSLGGRPSEPPRPGEAPPGPPDTGEWEREMLDLLTNGTLEVAGRLVDASNVTMYCKISGDSGEVACVYKPVAGERPLWDFPEGTLAGREVAAYEVSRAAGWNVVP